MMLSLFVMLTLLSQEVNMAPVDVEEVEVCNALGSDDEYIQEELDQILQEGLLNNTENLDKIKAAFDVNSLFCFPLTYSITCTDQEECENTTANTFNCSTGYNSTFIWTRFDPTRLAGEVLFFYAKQRWEIFGFEWGDACDLRFESAKLLTIDVPSLAILCDVDGYAYLSRSLKKLTKKMPSFANTSTTKTGATTPEEVENAVVEYSLTELAITFVLSLVGLVTLHSQTPMKRLFKPEKIKEGQCLSIKDTQGARKLELNKRFFQFWALLLLLTVFAIATIKMNNFDYSYNIQILCSLGILNVLLVHSTGNVLYSPLQCFNCQCFKDCQYFKYFRCVMVFFISIMSVIAMTVCVIMIIVTFPNIIIIYYIYPIRTLARLPFLVNAALIIFKLTALLIFQCERYRYKFSQDECEDENEKGLLKGISDMIKYQNKYYKYYYTNEEFNNNSALTYLKYLYQPFGTMCLLVILIFFIKGINELFTLDTFGENELKLLLILAPSIILLLGSWFKIDLLAEVDEEEEEDEKKKKEDQEAEQRKYREKMLEELKKFNSGTTNADGADIDSGTATSGQVGTVTTEPPPATSGPSGEDVITPPASGPAIVGTVTIESPPATSEQIELVVVSDERTPLLQIQGTTYASLKED